MGCNLMDPALWFLELGNPLSIRSDGPPPNDEVALLGNVALRFPHETLAWDPKRMRFPRPPGGGSLPVVARARRLGRAPADLKAECLLLSRS
jgi:hypothetical protein